MTNSKTAKLLLERWVSELSSKDRSKNSLGDNFAELFYDMFRAGVPFDNAHATLQDAIKHHLPSQHVAKITYNKVKATKPGMSFNEFVDSWKKLITDEATQAFYSFYQVEGEDNKEEKKYGNMSAQEYSKQRKYADSFPTIDVDALRKKQEEMMREEGDDE